MSNVISEVRSRPILFSGPMVRAILAGEKTVTRRLVKPQPPAGTMAMRDVPFENRWWPALRGEGELGTSYTPIDADQQKMWACPYGVPGDRLWVRESWQAFHPGTAVPMRMIDPQPGICSIGFRATEDERAEAFGSRYDGPWRPSIHMPRWASRITLEQLDVRVELLQDITEDEARAEGVESREAFVELWDKINGKRATWKSNPFVWVVGFKRIEAAP